MTVYVQGSKNQFTLRMALYVIAHTWMYGAVCRRTLKQNAAVANYMLLTVVVNGHNCVAVCRYMATDGNKMHHDLRLLSSKLHPSTSDDAVFV